MASPTQILPSASCNESLMLVIVAKVSDVDGTTSDMVVPAVWSELNSKFIFRVGSSASSNVTLVSVNESTVTTPAAVIDKSPLRVCAVGVPLASDTNI